LKAGVARNPHSQVNPLFPSYVLIARSLLPTTVDAGLLGPSLQSLGASGGIDPSQVARWFKAERADATGTPVCIGTSPGHWLTALPMMAPEGRMLGVWLVQQSLPSAPPQPSRHALLLANTLKPLLDCVARDLTVAFPEEPQLRTLTERSAELEWLFKLTSSLRESADDRHLLEQLIDASARRLQCGFGALFVPGKRLSIEKPVEEAHEPELLRAWARTKQPALTWAQRQHKPLVVNGSRQVKGEAPCKVLAVPVTRDNGFVSGVLLFLRHPGAPDFTDQHVFLARHLGRQAGQLVDRQFDLMTGLYTRGGLEEMAMQILTTRGDEEHSLVYFDIDHMHVVNQLHGFEIGNELIVRVADLLAAPLLPDSALAARIDSDAFVVLLPRCTAKEAQAVAERVCEAARRLALGTKEEAVEVSISGGIAPFLDVPPPFPRALATAELACKTAKAHGRGRVELYAIDDESMMRRHDDVIAVGRLREALKANQFVLYAQPIVSLGHKSYSGYEILLRIRNEDGTVSSPGEFMYAASRYQLLPNIDKWVTEQALEMLSPYRSMLSSRGVGMALNVTGQSICDESFVNQLARNLKEARLPPDCITIEITEQAAVTNLPRANQLISLLKELGCQFALDDFGTGANSLTTLKQLQISRIKIDGSFVREVASDRNSRSTVRAIVELAEGLSIDTVAEHVETREIADELRALRVDYAQGYAFGRPQPLGEILRSLNEEESQRLHRLYLEI
jgi:diguanylate cyclase (GGDEF)-like protein